VLLATLFLSARAGATEEFARQTGKDCSACHVDPGGDGELTAAGRAFLAQRVAAGQAVPASTVRHVVRFAAGFLHLFTAVLWFGTILYVHLLLKPAYASRGLPRGELIIGWSSIAVMAVTGTILTLFRIPTWDALFHTRFGVILSIKIAFFLVMVATAFLATFVIGPRLKRRIAAVGPRQGEMTAAELEAFTGKEGAPSYFAYKSVVYDASASKLWKRGSHAGKHLAGFDLSDALALAPHGEDRVFRLPAVGKVVPDGAAPRKPFHLAAFYFMTFLNLFLVVGVLFLVALWRWW
jgi:predicted heme/steroid binding protein/uncharacterized membrane protein